MVSFTFVQLRSHWLLMMWMSTLLYGLGLMPMAFGQGGLVINPRNKDDNESGGSGSLPIDLSDLVNNRAFAMSPGDADYDGMHSGIPAEFLPETNLTYSGVNYIFPEYKETGNDNVLAQGQVLAPPKGRYFSIQMLAAAEDAVASGNVTAMYSDNTTASGSILVDPWWAWPYPYGGDLIFPYYLTNSSIDYNRSMIFQTINWLDSTKELVGLQLPNVTAGSSNSPGGAAQTTRLHIFAVSLIPANSSGISLEIQHARSTQTWFEGTNKTQIIEVRINNVGDDWVLANNSVKVTIESPGLTTNVPGVVNRLRPGDQAIVQIGVVNTEGTAPGTTGEATVLISGNHVDVSSKFNATYGIGSYDATYESIYAHESTPWFNAAKYGIFIHWGVYAVPGWGDVGDAGEYDPTSSNSLLLIDL